jgi:DNA mismatch endonuclease, patch repair protein
MAFLSPRKKRSRTRSTPDRVSITRSENMRRIRSKDTLPERLVRHYLHEQGLRYRLHLSNLPGKPDLVFLGKKVAVFVHGCFWHQHANCVEASRPRSNSSYWISKLIGNVERDRKHNFALKELGFTVFVLWECEVETNVSAAAASLLAILTA